MQQLDAIECKHKQQTLEALKEDLVRVKNETTLMYANLVAKDMIAKQRIFEFQDKPGKTLAKILAETPQNNQNLQIKLQDGTLQLNQKKNYTFS